MTIGETLKYVRNAGKKIIIILIFSQKIMVINALTWLLLLPWPISSSFIQTKLEITGRHLTWIIEKKIERYQHDQIHRKKQLIIKLFDCLWWPNLEEIIWVENQIEDIAGCRKDIDIL